MKRILCVVSHVLGNRTFSDVLVRRLKTLPGITVDVISVGGDDFKKYPSDRISRLSNTWEAAAVIRKKFAIEGLPPHDAIIFNGLGIAVEVLASHKRHCPAAIATDTTPKLIADQQLVLRPPKAKVPLLQMSKAQQKWRIGRISKTVSSFLPVSTWCRDSLVEDYGIETERCLVTSMPRPLSSARSRRGEGPLRLLFVGNDFRRKGGDLLLAAFPSLADRCTLTIVSNDPVFEGMTLPSGVTVKAGLRTADEVASVYPQHHLLLFPTRLDQFGYVVPEAAAAGLPAVVTDVGGVKDLVRHEETGLVLPLEAGPKEWAEAIMRFVREVDMWQRCSDQMYALAANELSIQKFDGLLREVLVRMFGEGQVQ